LNIKGHVLKSCEVPKEEQIKRNTKLHRIHHHDHPKFQLHP